MSSKSVVVTDIAASVTAWLEKMDKDSQRRQEWIGTFQSGQASGTHTERTAIEKGEALFAAFEVSKGALVASGQFEALHARVKFEDRRLIGVSNAIVNGTAATDLLSFLMVPNDRYTAMERPDALFSTSLLATVNEHHNVASSVAYIKHVGQAWAFLTSSICKQVMDDVGETVAYTFVAVPLSTHPSFKPEDGVRRADLTQCVRLTTTAPTVVKLEYAFALEDLPCLIPKHVAIQLALNLSTLPFTLRIFMAKIKPSGMCTADDGRLIGRHLMSSLRGIRSRDQIPAIDQYVMQTEMLRTASLPYLSSLLGSAIRATFPSAKDVKEIDPTLLTKTEAELIGSAMKSIFLRNQIPADAVEDILGKYPALRQMDRDHPWFRAFIEAIATGVMATSWRSQLQLVMSVLLSLFDVYSDVYSMAMYFLLQQSGTAFAILGSIFASILGQTLVVWLQNRHLGGRAVVTEVLIVWSFFKPAVDARRLATGREIEGGPFDTTQERAFCSTCETLLESLPASIIQLIGYMRLEQHVWGPVVSVMISWVVTAHKVASLSIRLDANPHKRWLDPWLYGFVPNNGARRTLTRSALFALSLAHVTARTSAVALLYLTEPKWLAGYWCIDILLFLLYKVARYDIISWVPGAGVIVSLIYRIGCKLMSDLTGWVHLRHPVELGGAYWAFNLLANQVACFVAAWLYSAHYKGANKFADPALFGFMGTLAAVWVLATLTLFLAMSRKHAWTFVSTMTGRQFSLNTFLDNQADDEKRIHIFKRNTAHWKSIRPDVTLWVEANYARWRQEDAPWLTAAVIATIPNSMLPDDVA